MCLITRLNIRITYIRVETFNYLRNNKKKRTRKKDFQELKVKRGKYSNESKDSTHESLFLNSQYEFILMSWIVYIVDNTAEVPHG